MTTSRTAGDSWQSTLPGLARLAMIAVACLIVTRADGRARFAPSKPAA